MWRTRGTPIGIGLVVLAPIVAAQEPTAASWWNQPRGNAAGTAASTLAGVHAQPVEEWRLQVGEILCEPVVWNGVAYVVAGKSDERRFLACRIRGGKLLDSKSIGKSTNVSLAVWSDTVLLIQGDKISSFWYRNESLKPAKSLQLEGRLGPPCLHERFLFLCDGDELLCVDIQKMKVLARTPGGSERPALRGQGSAASIATLAIEDTQAGGRLIFHETRVEGLDGATPTLMPLPSTRFENALALEHALVPGHAVYLGEELYRNVWYLHSPRPLVKGGSVFRGCTTAGRLCQVSTSEAVVDRTVLGFGDDGTLWRLDELGVNHALVESADLPTRARVGPATVASDVLYVGNWAVDLTSSRVLWCLPDVEPTTPMVPTEDGRFVVGTAKGELIGFLDPNRAAAVEASTKRSPSALRPDAADALVLVDGTVLAGKLRRGENGALQVTSGPDDSRELDPRTIAFGRTDAGERIGRAEYPVYSAWRKALLAELVESLAEIALGCARDRHVADARRLLQEARELGLPEERQRAIETALTGKLESKDANAGAKLQKKRAEERACRERSAAALLAAADWCSERDLDAAATGLLGCSRRLLPDQPAAPLVERALALLPPEFPWRDRKDSAWIWIDWAEELLPAEAVFLARDDPAWGSMPERWKQQAIGLRTRNLLFFSLANDAAILGRCLRKGEGTLRVLDELFLGDTEPAGERSPLQVRLHADQEGYLQEGSEEGRDLYWSAGFYSPAENVSRFYVPRAADAKLLDRELDSTMAHELTHHYLEQRWQPVRELPGLPGFWVVEGFARFMEDQVLELGRARRGLEDATVLSLDSSAQALKADGLVPIGFLVDASYKHWHELGNTPIGTLRLRYTIATVTPTERSLFYDQSASLVFFLMNRCGDEGRAALLAYMKDYHIGKTPRLGWKSLGWESAKALEEAFKTFLRTVAE